MLIASSDIEPSQVQWPSVARCEGQDEPAAISARHAIELAVAQVFDVDIARLRGSARDKAEIALARQVAMYLAHIACGKTFTDIGNDFARDRTTVAHACGVVEDRRDDPVFDRVLDLLEWAVPSLAVRTSATRHLTYTS